LQPSLADAAAELGDVYVNGCLRSAWQVEQPDCASGEIGSPTTATVVGDSNSAMWNPAFRTIAEQRGWQVHMFGKAGCPLMDLPTF
ncbi:acyltransferase, partial [Mycobacterium sp. ITM-2017-0098]